MTLFLDLQAGAEVRAAVLTGAGRGFCAGGDFSVARVPPKSGLTTLQEARRIVDNILGLENLADGPSYAIQSTKVSVNQFVKLVSNLVLPFSLALEEVSMTKDDHAEAVRAFQERREPRFTRR